MDNSKVIFVYNAESGLVNAGKDLFHKTFRPESYACNLCALTYQLAWKRPEWSSYLKNLNVETEFEYRDTLAAKYGIVDAPLPAIFRQEAGEAPELWIDAETINDCATLEELIEITSSRLATKQPALQLAPHLKRAA